MIKIKSIIEKLPGVEVISGKCDWCGNPFDKKIIKLTGQPYGEVEVRFGYGSKYDDDKWIGEICDDCFEKEIKPKLRKSNGNE